MNFGCCSEVWARPGRARLNSTCLVVLKEERYLLTYMKSNLASPHSYGRMVFSVLRCCLSRLQRGRVSGIRLGEVFNFPEWRKKTCFYNKLMYKKQVQGWPKILKTLVKSLERAKDFFKAKFKDIMVMCRWTVILELNVMEHFPFPPEVLCVMEVKEHLQQYCYNYMIIHPLKK